MGFDFGCQDLDFGIVLALITNYTLCILHFHLCLLISTLSFTLYTAFGIVVHFLFFSVTNQNFLTCFLLNFFYLHFLKSEIAKPTSEIPNPCIHSPKSSVRRFSVADFAQLSILLNNIYG